MPAKCLKRLGFKFMNTEGGRKFDDGKLPYDLLPPEFLEGTAAVLGFGAQKYSARNWEIGIDASHVGVVARGRQRPRDRLFPSVACCMLHRLSDGV